MSIHLQAARHLLPALLLVQIGVAGAQTVVYRCPGPPVLYTDALSAKEAQEKGCRTIEGAPVTVLQPARRLAPAASGTVSSNARPNEGKVESQQQRGRDSERRSVLQAELRDAEARLSELRAEYNNGTPERRGEERNYQKYLDRVAELKASIGRQEADIEALKREISKLP
jgi:predicted RNase H-like nuclease (RuvC/YqgF family)